MDDQYTPGDAHKLLRIARQALEVAVRGSDPRLPYLKALPAARREPRACFVTLHTTSGALRGCTGVLAARQPLAHEVSHTAVQTAFRDPRFPPLQAYELTDVVIEISILTPPVELQFLSPAEIPALLRPHVDGVILLLGGSRGTFLPQVWERTPEPVAFLDLLCWKIGLPPGAWKQDGVKIMTYQTIIFAEEPAG